LEAFLDRPPRRRANGGFDAQELLMNAVSHVKANRPDSEAAKDVQDFRPTSVLTLKPKAKSNQISDAKRTREVGFYLGLTCNILELHDGQHFSFTQSPLKHLPFSSRLVYLQKFPKLRKNGQGVVLRLRTE
jgi:hypothetical protein